jgi:hypothetical protein
MHGRDQEKDAVKTPTYDEQIFGLSKFFYIWEGVGPVVAESTDRALWYAVTTKKKCKIYNMSRSSSLSVPPPIVVKLIYLFFL